MASSKHPDLKGVVLSSAEPVFYDAKYTAEMIWQGANKSTQALATAADLVLHRAIAAAAVTADGTDHLGNPSRQAIHDLTGQWS